MRSGIGKTIAAIIAGAALLAALTGIAQAQPLFPASSSPLPPVANGQNAPPLVPVAVFGKDQRRSLPAKYKALKRKIGLLHNSRTNTLCSAFCVGPDLIATASHCLFTRRRGHRLHLSDYLFKLSPSSRKDRKNTKLAGSRSGHVRHYLVAGTSKLNRKPPIGAVRDWALARLARPVCKAGWLTSMPLSYKQLKSAADGKKLFQVAFHMDFGNWKLAHSGSCKVSRRFGGLSWRDIKKHFAAPNSLIMHRCDTGEASSGSPLLMDTPDGPVVVGINVGTYQQRDVVIRSGRIIKRSRYKTIANTGVATPEFLRQIKILQNAKVIENRAALKQLQAGLRERGFYHGSVDGIYGSRTELAIKAFERRTNRPVTGLASQELLALLRKNSAGDVSIETSAGQSQRP